MRLYIGFAALLLCILFSIAPAQAQVITEGPDSVRVLTPDTLATTEKGFFLSNLKDLDKPGKAALYSAIIPGAGQFYNRAYWKVPIVYATGAVLGYFLIDNHRNYKSYETALNIRAKMGTASTDEYADHSFLGVDNGVSPGSPAFNNLKYRRDYYRRNRDLTILLSIGAHVLQIAEAYVHAHLKDFDVSDNLAIRIQPAVVPVPAVGNSIAPALSFTLYTRSK